MLLGIYLQSEGKEGSIWVLLGYKTVNMSFGVRACFLALGERGFRPLVGGFKCTETLSVWRPRCLAAARSSLVVSQRREDEGVFRLQVGAQLPTRL